MDQCLCEWFPPTSLALMQINPMRVFRQITCEGFYLPERLKCQGLFALQQDQRGVWMIKPVTFMCQRQSTEQERVGEVWGLWCDPSPV